MHGDRAGQALAEVFKQVGRADLVGDQYEAASRLVDADAGIDARDPLEDPPPDLADVGGTLAQCLVGQRLDASAA